MNFLLITKDVPMYYINHHILTLMLDLLSNRCSLFIMFTFFNFGGSLRCIPLLVVTGNGLRNAESESNN